MIVNHNFTYLLIFRPFPRMYDTKNTKCAV